MKKVFFLRHKNVNKLRNLSLHAFWLSTLLSYGYLFYFEGTKFKSPNHSILQQYILMYFGEI